MSGWRAAPGLALSRNIAKIGSPRAAELPSLGKRKQQQHKFFGPEPKMQWHARRERRVRKWQEAQHSVNTLISAVVKKTKPRA